MNLEQNKYLESIGITGPLLKKVDEIADFYTKYLGIEIENVFISEFSNKDGSRIFENLWFFNKSFCYEAKLFNLQEDYDCDLIKDAIFSFTIKKVDFDIIQNITNENSRMFLDFALKNSSTGRGGELKASKENCKQLSFIFKKYILPNQGSEVK